jgi:AcrR family transcriptional regulator
MKKPKSLNSGTADLRLAIIQTALGCFIEQGYASTAIGDVCRAAEISVGSLYHHFKSKEQLARAVYMEGIKNYQAGYADGLMRSTSAKNGIYHVIRYHLDWISMSPQWAKFLFQYRHAEFMAGTEEDFTLLNNEFNRTTGEWFSKQIRDGKIRKLPPDIYHCLLMGPCQEYAAMYLFGEVKTDIDKAALLIAANAWETLKV